MTPLFSVSISGGGSVLAANCEQTPLELLHEMKPRIAKIHSELNMEHLGDYDLDCLAINVHSVNLDADKQRIPYPTTFVELLDAIENEYRENLKVMIPPGK